VREEGQWTAYSRFAAAGAQMQGNGASGSAQSWLAGRTNPLAADRWVPREAWSSCDGSAVVVVGTSVDPAGKWSRFTRVWERQQGGDFRWGYSLSLADPELTQARERERAEADALGDEAILVEAGNFIRAKVADCASPRPPVSESDAIGQADAPSGQSRDRTLRWNWTSSGTDAGTFAAYSWNGAGWDAVHSEPVASVGE
jgi:hypothetical protein